MTLLSDGVASGRKTLISDNEGIYVRNMEYVVVNEDLFKHPLCNQVTSYSPGCWNAAN